jgi:hypothetical protein
MTMTIYRCDKCLKSFKKKSHLDDHINKKKKPCINDLSPIAITESDNVNKLTHNNLSNEHFFCEYCNKKYTRKDSLSKHLKLRCKLKQKTEEFDVLKQMLVKILNENNEFRKELENFKSNPISSSLSKTTNISNTLTNNVINNTNTNLIVQFGKEDLSKMNVIEAMNVYLKSTGGNIISNMLKHINFNPAHPENFNIYMTDLAREIVKIHDGKKFVSKKFNTVKDEIINNVSSHINDICKKYIKSNKSKNSIELLKKININNISLKLIAGEEIDDLIIKKYLLSENNNEPSQNTDEMNNMELTPYQKRDLIYYENKRLGLQEITNEKIRDELYNNRKLF